MTLRGRPTEEVLDFYRTLESPDPDYVGYSQPSLKRVLVETASKLPGDRLVELGCGPNPVVLLELAERGKRVTGLDLSADFCDDARAAAARRGIELEVECASVHDTPFGDDRFDIAIMSEVLEHVPDSLERPALAEARRILRPGGRLVISVPNRDSLFTRYLDWRNRSKFEHPEHLREYTSDSLGALLEDVGFAIERPLRVPATTEPPWRERAAWAIDRVTLRARWSLKAAFVAVAD